MTPTQTATYKQHKHDTSKDNDARNKGANTDNGPIKKTHTTKPAPAKTIIRPPEYTHPEPVDFKYHAILCQHDLHYKAYDQAVKERHARAVVLWTSGQGIGAVAAVLNEFPVLAVALSDLHEAIATDAIDVAIAQDLQVEDPAL